ncbi:MAG: hypothetical protein ABJP45_11875 [Cyclobacteriaceae bacterium]
MKNIYYLLIAMLVVSACTEDFDLTEQYGSVEELPAYVAFNPDGTNAVIDDEDVEETDGTVTFSIENPTGTESDITVNYDLSGTAVFGTDFTITGATATGGSIVIPHKQSATPDDFQNFDNVDLDVTLLTDAITDGTKTLNITLTSASNAAGNIAVGRGGTDALRTAIVNIADSPLGFDLSATSASHIENSPSDTIKFSIDLGYAADVALTYDLTVDPTSSLGGGSYSFNNATGLAVPGVGISIDAGETSSDFELIIADDGALSATANAEGVDSLSFIVTNVAMAGRNVTLGEDTVKILIQDDAKRFAFTDTTATASSFEVFNYAVALTDTLSGDASTAFADVTIPYTIDAASTAVAAVDYNDVTNGGGFVTIKAGESSGNISIQVLTTGQATPPTVIINLGAAAVASEAEVLGAGDDDTLTITIK